MFKNKKITADDANTLNFGIPLVLALFFIIFNGVLFSLYFAESATELLKMYLFFAFIILTIDFIRAKLKKKSKVVVQLNAYKNVVLNLFLTLVFMGLNFISAETIFETKILCDSTYSKLLKNYSIPAKFEKFYIIESKEVENYFTGNYYLEVKVAKSFLGYKILEERVFKKIKEN